MVSKKIKPELYHTHVTNMTSSKKCFEKLREELGELLDALRKGSDVDNIKEELADVENCIPYMHSYFSSTKKVREIAYKGVVREPVFMIKLWIDVYDIMSAYKFDNVFIPVLDILMDIVCESLYVLYDRYNFNVMDIEWIKNSKRTRTIDRLLGRSNE